MSQKVDPKLLEILVCPLTKAPLRYDEAGAELISDKARLAYPIRDGIPIMLVDEARQLDDAPAEPDVGESGLGEPGVGDGTGGGTGGGTGDGVAGR